MKIYKVDKVLGSDVGGEHDGYYYTTSKKEAELAVKDQDIDALIMSGLKPP